MCSVLQLPDLLGKPQQHFMHGTKAKPNGSIRLPPRKDRGQKAKANMNRAAPEHILAMCNVSMPDPL